MEFIIRIEMGFNVVNTRWDGRLYLEKGKIKKGVGKGFDRNPADSLDSSSCSWKCTILGRDSEYKKSSRNLSKSPANMGIISMMR